MSIKKTKRTRHTEEFKTEALKLADSIGVAKAARQLSLHESQLYAWRKAIKHNASITGREKELVSENAKLKRLLAEQAEELEVVKRPQPTSPSI